MIHNFYVGKKVDGIVWWGADDYFFRQKEKGVAKKIKTVLDTSN